MGVCGILGIEENRRNRRREGIVVWGGLWVGRMGRGNELSLFGVEDMLIGESGGKGWEERLGWEW